MSNRQLNESELQHKARLGGYGRVMAFCHTENCCPTLSISKTAAPQKAVRITDDFGSQIHMSTTQLETIVEFAKSGKIKTD